MLIINLVFSKPIVVFRGENTAFKFIEAVLKEFKYCKKIMKKHLNKTLIMTKEKEKQLQWSNICWICRKLIAGEKVRDYFHITRKFRGAAHWSYNIKLQLT